MDLMTGVIKVLKAASVFDVGKVINPLLLKMQLDGGFVMGLSIGLYEKIKFDEQGWVTNPNLSSYYVARMKDIPREFVADFVETPQSDGPLGARGIGELSMIAVASAISNAVFGATGVKLNDLPMSPEAVWKAIRAQRPDLLKSAMDGYDGVEIPDGGQTMSFGSPYLTLPEFEYHRPETIDEVIELLQKYGGDAAVMAGGVGLLAFMKERLVSPAHVIDIKGVKQLRQTKYTAGESIRIGASVTLSELAANDVLRTKFPALHNAASWIADSIIRERATLVGNLCEAIPWVDSPAALIALEAKVEIAGSQGTRSVNVEDFIRGPVEIDINPGEFVTGVMVPDVPSRKSAFDKFNTGR